MKPPIIYNLFPRLIGPVTGWGDHARRAAEMGFNWIFVNPWYYPGFSGSLYAPKDYHRLNPLFVPPGTDELSLDPLRGFLEESRTLGIPVMTDLVVNHTARDSPLVRDRPGWFVRDAAGDVVSPSVRDPDDPTRVTVWGDLAEVDNQNAEDRDALWAFWAGLVRDALELGFSGFRCDAAYMVPADLWRYLVKEARTIAPGSVFFAETLGAPVEKVLELHGAGLDYFFNSSKWWDFRQPWAIEQHERFGAIAPSISFPETHDTTRLAGDTHGDAAVQRQRYAFAAAFSAGLMMPLGYEFGFRRKTDVVHTSPDDWETPSFDLRQFVTRVNALKSREPSLQTEGRLRVHHAENPEVVVIERRVDALPDSAYILVNTDTAFDRTLTPGALPADLSNLRLFRVCRDGFTGSAEHASEPVHLERAEVVYLLP